MEDNKAAETPLMKQYYQFKAQYPDAILLFRVGDFYETFGDDAITASKVLGIVLTKRSNGAAAKMDLAGFPHHAIDVYLPKLVRGGYKVAVCDQLEDPKLTKKLVKRGVTELITPGVAYNDQLLDNKSNNFLAAIHYDRENVGAAFIDISTGAFKVAQGSRQYIDTLIAGLNPSEVLLKKGTEHLFKEKYGDSIYISRIDEWAFVKEAAIAKLNDKFGAKALKGFGVDRMTSALTAAGAILSYLELTQHTELSHVCSIQRIDESEYVWIDRFTFRNLEIFRSLSEHDGGVSLLDVLDNTRCPMGGRTLKSWLATPLKSVPRINRRLDCVEYFRTHDEIREQVSESLCDIGDMERLISKAAAGRILPREMMQLKRGLKHIAPVREICLKSEVPALEKMGQEFDCCSELIAELERTLTSDPAQSIGKGDVIAAGVNEQLDHLRDIARNSKSLLSRIVENETEKTGISSLKIGYNNVFGYYLEVRNTHKDKVPEEWIRKQTLVNAERYITQELKEYEEQILGAEDKILVLEQQIYTNLVMKVQREVPTVAMNATLIGEVDCLVCFADSAIRYNYCRPEVDDSNELDIKDGRHPVIERMMPPGEEYVSNSLHLDNTKQQIIILTGPNMAGKSALLRQTALIVLMAQIGSYIPASAARIGYMDKIFTRVGASDNISKGESTFMVEMLETSTILHNLSARSLVLLDEIGRGTSTYDGMSIAWSIVEYIHESLFRAKTLFATHYHELNELENIYDRVHNYHIATKESDGKVIFLRKLTEGGVAHSFGIHVARVAGMPSKVVYQAEKKLQELEERHADEINRNTTAPKSDKEGKKVSGVPVPGRKDNRKPQGMQLSFFQLEDPILADVRATLDGLDLNTMSPLDAFDALRSLKEKIAK